MKPHEVETFQRHTKFVRQFLLISNLTHFFQCIYLFPFSTCFEQPSARHQENRIVSIHHLVYVTLCRWLPGIIDAIRFSWWRALGCSKHVDKGNKWIHLKKCVTLVINKNCKITCRTERNSQKQHYWWLQSSGTHVQQPNNQRDNTCCMATHYFHKRNSSSVIRKIFKLIYTHY